MLQIDRFSRIPVYEQVISQIEEMIAKGLYAAGDILPSVRNLSQELNVNPNTLQKAYSELERKGLCISAPGSGRYIAKDARRMLLESKKGRLEDLAGLARELKAAGIGFEEIVSCIKNVYSD